MSFRGWPAEALEFYDGLEADNSKAYWTEHKSAYKTHIGAVIGDGYIQLSSNGLAAGSGMYGMAPDQLDRYRAAVAADQTGEELERVISRIERHGIAVNGHDALKTAPR